MRMVERIKPLVRATRRPGADAEIGGFGGLFDLKAAGFNDPILVAANDGVGTKVKIAIETGIHDTIGIDLVAMCVNDLVVQGAEPLFFLDYFATGKLDPASRRRRSSPASPRAACEAGCALIGGETAEMPGLYAGGDYDLAGFRRRRRRARRRCCRAADIAAGDVMFGLPSSGVHSNGFSLVRKIVERAGLDWDAPAPFAPGKTLGEALLTPTRIYVKPLLARARKRRRRSRRSPISPAAAFPTIFRACCPRVSASRSTSARFRSCRCSAGWRAAGGVAEREMLRTFNCGIGMIVVADAAHAHEAEEALRASGEEPVRLGEVIVAPDGERVEFSGKLAL